MQLVRQSLHVKSARIINWYSQPCSCVDLNKYILTPLFTSFYKTYIKDIFTVSMYCRSSMIMFSFSVNGKESTEAVLNPSSGGPVWRDNSPLPANQPPVTISPLSPTVSSPARKDSPPFESCTVQHNSPAAKAASGRQISPTDESCPARHYSPPAASYPVRHRTPPIENDSLPLGLNGAASLTDNVCGIYSDKNITSEDNNDFLTTVHSAAEDASVRSILRPSAVRQSVSGPPMAASPTEVFSAQERVFFSLPKKSHSAASHQLLQESRQQPCSFHTFKGQPPLSAACGVSRRPREELPLNAEKPIRFSPSLSLGFSTLPPANFFSTGVSSPPCHLLPE
jgi:hypothetical protein